MPTVKNGLVWKRQPGRRRNGLTHDLGQRRRRRVITLRIGLCESGDDTSDSTVVLDAFEWSTETSRQALSERSREGGVGTHAPRAGDSSALPLVVTDLPVRAD